MSRRLYVGNLNYAVDSNALTSCFGAIGTVESAHVVMDRESGRSKGFGFVEMTTSEDAATAIQNLDGTELDGRALRVSEARPREDRPSGGNGRGSW